MDVCVGQAIQQLKIASRNIEQANKLGGDDRIAPGNERRLNGIAEEISGIDADILMATAASRGEARATRQKST